MSDLSILNVGHGDTKLSFDPADLKERARAKQIVKDMIALGYAICVKEGDRWVRVKKFDAEHAEYLIQEKQRRGPAVGRVRRLPAHGTKAVAVGRSAGGMSVQADSVEMQNLREHDRFHPLRNQIAELADKAGEWAGIPMPMADSPLVIDPKYPFAAAIGRKEEPPDPSIKMRNRFWSSRYHCDVLIWEENGKLEWGIDRNSPATLQLLTLGASFAWGIEQEANAVKTLAELIPHHAFKCYMLTGTFIESSPRSNVSYIFRRLRPTLALRPSEDGSCMHTIAALCMHPIAYYENSWAGAMCPTDDVIAHLTLMRSDEKLYWRRCNQHPAWRPEAGL